MLISMEDGGRALPKSSFMEGARLRVSSMLDHNYFYINSVLNTICSRDLSPMIYTTLNICSKQLFFKIRTNRKS
jgi:hypothetical protein